MRKMTLAISMFAGLASSAVALAQEVPLETTIEMKEIDIHGNPVVRGPYADRAIGVVFDNGFSTTAGALLNGTALGSTHTLEDFDLTGGPLGLAAVKRITGIGYTIQSSGTGCTSPQTYDVLLEVFQGSSCSYTNPEMLNNGTSDAVPVFAARVATSQNCAIQSLYTLNLAPNGVGGAGDVSFVLTSNQGFIRMRIVEPGTTTLRPYPSAGTGTQFQSPVHGTGAGAFAVGTITNGYGRDINGDGTNLAFPYAGGASGLLGGSPIITGGGAGAHEYRQVAATPTRTWRMKLDGEIICTAPSATDLGSIPNGETANSSALAAGETKWFRFEVGAVSDTNETFLDLDCEGSTVADLTMALYNADGTRLAVDFDDGSGTLPQLTYGICRRAAVGDGRQYDGRDGELAAGVYYVGVGANGVNFQSCFNVTNATTDVGTVAVRLTTNASPSGSVPPAPSVSPVADQDFATLLAPGAQSTETAAGPLNTSWYKFNLAESTSATTYVDVHTSLTSSNTVDCEIAVFNNLGNLVATDDDDSINNHAALSFGAAGSPRPAVGNGLPFDGRDGDLSSGDYYVAVALFNMIPANTRWCARTNSGSNLGVVLTLDTNSDGAPDSCHGTCVADFDDGSGTGVPDMGVTIDDLLYYLVIFETGVICADVDDGSGTGTPDMGVTIDDLLYFLFRFEAGC